MSEDARKTFIDPATGAEWTVFVEHGVVSIVQSGLDEPCIHAGVAMAREVAEFILQTTAMSEP